MGFSRALTCFFLSSLAPSVRSACPCFSSTVIAIVHPCDNSTQLVKHNDANLFTGLSVNQTSAPVGVNPECGIERVGHDGSLSNIANVIACALSIFVVLFLLVVTGGRKAAVGESDSDSERASD
jgi:hypothetical protein